jgi:quercetin dioxygenase-like cupin family protein
MDSTSLTRLADEQLDLARQASSGRSADTVYGGARNRLRQTVIAMLAGQRMDEHENPGEATLQVLRGRVRVTAGEAGQDASAGDLLVIPQERHAVEVLEDAVLLLTVAKLG